MVVLGAFVGPGRIAASLSRDGAVLAAELSLPGADEALAALAARCVGHAGLAMGDVDEIVFCEAGAVDAVVADRGDREALARAFPRARLRAFPTEQAHLELLRSLSAAERAAVVLCGSGEGGSVGLLRDRQIVRSAPIEGSAEIACAVSAVADAIGRRTEHPIEFLEQTAAGAEAEPIEAAWISWAPHRAIHIDRTRLLRDVARCQGGSERGTPVEGVLARQQLATAILDNVADIVASLSRSWMLETGPPAVTLAGGLFASQEFRSRVQRRLECADWLATPSDALAALGASLQPFGAAAPMTSLALGSSFDEQAVKLVLENCRLDYVYEPRWNRLLDLVSRLLSAGSLVAWFQGRGDFGEASFGSRSILADPTSAYARENVNVFLLGRSANAPLPLALSNGLSDGLRMEGVPVEVQVMPAADWAAKVRGATDRRGSIRVTRGGLAAGLQDLLDAHSRRTGVPALINVPLSGQSTPLANTPRSAVQSLFGSSADCLVIGRFIVAKDYWLLRNRAQ